MPVKFEWQFKHRDERFLNADRRHARMRGRKPSIHAGFLHFCGFRFTLPVGDRVTIAKTGSAAGRMSRRRHPPRSFNNELGRRMTLRSSALQNSTIKMGKLDHRRG
jgi:hypothetical protein